MELVTDLQPLFYYYNQIIGGNQNRFRENQVKFMISCHEAVSNNLACVIEGPTGLGKTKALLTVGQTFLAKDISNRVIYATRTIPQLINVESDLRQISESTENKDGIAYSVFLGVDSLIRIGCSYIINFEDNNESSGRYSEFQCENCPIKSTKQKKDIIDTDFSSFGLAEIKECLKSAQCPLPYMRELAKKAKTLLVTYPYLFNDHWKHIYLDLDKNKNKLLPIFDEAHNIVELLTKTTYLDLNFGENPNQYASRNGSDPYLVHNIKSSVKKFTQNFLHGSLKRFSSEIYTQVSAKIDEIKVLKNQKSSLIERIRQNSNTFNQFTTNIKSLKKGENFLATFKISRSWQEPVNKGFNCFEKANEIKSKIDSIYNLASTSGLEREQNNEKIRHLIGDRNELQKAGKEYRDLAFKKQDQERDLLHHKANRNYQSAQELHLRLTEIAARNQLLTSKINNYYLTINELKQECQRLWTQGESFFSSAFEEFNRTKRVDKEAINKIDEKTLIISDSIAELRERIGIARHKLKDIKRIQLNDEGLIYSMLDFLNFVEEPNYGSLIDFINKHKIYVNRIQELWELLLEVFAEEDGVLYGPIVISLIDRICTNIESRNLDGIDAFLTSIYGLRLGLEKNDVIKTEHWDTIPYFEVEKIVRVFKKMMVNPYCFAVQVNKSNELVVSIFVIDPAISFEDAWAQMKPPILASATLSPVLDVANVLGVQDSIKSKVESSFSPSSYLSFAIMGVHTAFKEGLDLFSPRELDILRITIFNILESTKVNTGLFCASHNVLDSILKIIRKDRINSLGMFQLVARTDDCNNQDDLDYLIQKEGLEIPDGLTEFDKRLFLFTNHSNTHPIILCGVTGGGLGEGVDFKSKLMELAIIIGIPYEGEDENAWLNGLRTSLFKMRTGSGELGKDLAYRQNAIRKMAQTAGRIHRTETDKGAIVFFDERLLGIKNTGISEMPYEYLNIENSRNHWEIIQDNIFSSLKIVPFPDRHESVSNEMKHVTKVFSNKSNDIHFVSQDEMINELQTFF
jgi:Rad3-related DNA helicase